MRYISLFSGVGGFDLGFDRAGMTPVLQVEKDRFARDILAKHWPDVPKMEDVRYVNATNAPPTDLICGGFPCQDVSVSGNRAGLAGGRSGLWFEFARIISEIKPAWVVIENVPGLLSSNGGRDFGTIIGGLEQFGYWWAYRTLDAQFFGVPQRRRRLFIVASLTKGLPQQVLFEPESVFGDTPPSRETGAELADTLGGNLAKRGGQRDGIGAWVPVAFAQNQRDEIREIGGAGQITGALSNQPGTKQQTFLAYGGGNGEAIDIATPCNVSERYDFDSSRAQVTGDIAAPLRVNGAQKPGVNDGKPDNMCISGAMGVRRLTPVECERLQGFPDNWTEGQSDTQRYRQMGNAVCVPVAAWMGRRLMECF